MTKNFLVKALAITAALMGVATVVDAQVHASDIVIRIEGGTIETGFVSGATGLPAYPQRVFAATLDASGFTNNPGFDSLEGAFSPAARVGFDILGALHKWDGVNFDPLSTSSMRIRFGGSTVFTPETDVFTPGFSTVPQSSGEFHRHFGYTLLAPAEQGVYLLNLRLWTDTPPGVTPSQPFWLVFNRSESNAVYVQAFDWATNNLGASPPACPADFNADGELDPDDLADFIGGYFSAPPIESTDFNDDGTVDPDDLADYIGAYFASCP